MIKRFLALLMVSFFAFCSCLFADVPSDPLPQIFLNGTKQLEVNVNQPVTLSLSLNSSQFVNTSAYWYLVEVGPQGIKTFKVEHWAWEDGFAWEAPSYVAPVFNFPLVNLLQVAPQVPGHYEYYFGLMVLAEPAFVVYDHVGLEVRPSSTNGTNNNHNGSSSQTTYVCAEKRADSVYVYLDPTCPRGYHEVGPEAMQSAENIIASLLTYGNIKVNLAHARQPKALAQCLSFLPAEITRANVEEYQNRFSACEQYW